MQTEDIDSSQVLRNWDAIKRAEKGSRSPPRSMVFRDALPALLEAAKLGGRAHKSGFDWPDVEGIFAKLEEETEELRQAIGFSYSAAHEDIVSEVGDMLFTMVNLARRLHVEPEFALRHTNAKFRRPFCRHGSRFAAAPRGPVCRAAGVALEPGQTCRKPPVSPSR